MPKIEKGPYKASGNLAGEDSTELKLLNYVTFQARFILRTISTWKQILQGKFNSIGEISCLEPGLLYLQMGE